MGKKNEKKASHENNVLDIIHDFFEKNHIFSNTPWYLRMVGYTAIATKSDDPIQIHGKYVSIYIVLRNLFKLVFSSNN